jgi:hypothetical protein
MTILTLPTGLKTLRIEWGQKRFDMRFENGDSGAGQSRILAPPRWIAGLMCSDALYQSDAAVWRDLILRLQGRINQLALYDLGNPAPRGTLRGTLTLNVAAAAGDTTLSVTGGAGQALNTLLVGDFIGVGSGSSRQLVAVSADATADAAGLIVVTVSQPMRYAQALASSVVWDKPTALFRQNNNDSKWSHERGIRSGYSLDLMESWE